MKTLKECITEEVHRRGLRYPRDCARIQFCAEQGGISLTPLEAEDIWQWHSTRQAAQWLTVPELTKGNDSAIDEILAVVREYIDTKAGALRKLCKP